MDKSDLLKICKSFEIDGEPVEVVPFGNGLINETALCTCKAAKGQVRYIIQRINGRLFGDIDSLMKNIISVTDHLSKKQGHIKSLNPIRTREGKSYLTDGGESYRMYDFIDGITLETVKNRKTFCECGRAYSSFIDALSDFDAGSLTEVIKDFHNTEKRYLDFKDSLERDTFKRSGECGELIDFAMERQAYCTRVTAMLNSGGLPFRVIHGDTKLNNVLFDKRGRALAVVDLDTIMKGASCYDFGDSVRSGLTRTAGALGTMGKIKLYKSYLKGFLSGGKITNAERSSLALGALVITYELGLRFLKDYLDGDIYFKTSYEGQNKDKTKRAFDLILFLEDNYEKLNNLAINY